MVGKQCVLIENVKDFRLLIDAVAEDHNIILNPAWIDELSADSAKSASYYKQWLVS